MMWRRYFLYFAGGALAYPVARYFRYLAQGRSVASSPEMVVKDAGGLAVKGSRIVKFNGRLVLLIRRAEHEWIALSAICTHMGCPLHYDPGVDGVVCVCHKGQYDLAGKVVSGPPPRALLKYMIEERGGELVLHD